jgi:hypothetical protein
MEETGLTSILMTSSGEMVSSKTQEQDIEKDICTYVYLDEKYH